MTGHRRRQPLEEVPFFREMSPEQRRKLETAGRRRLLGRGNCLFREGELSDGLHVLLVGQIRAFRAVPDGSEVFLHFVSAGELFGEVPGLLLRPYPATAEAVDDAEVYTLPLEAFKRLMREDPEIGLLFMRAMARKTAMLVERLELCKTPRAEQRVARSLVSRGQGSPPPGSICTVGKSKRLWAEELGLTPESLSRALTRLRAQNLIAVEGREIKLLDPAGLFRVAAGLPVTPGAPGTF